MQYRETRGGEGVFVCITPDGTGQVIPAWMFDAGVCRQIRVDAPRVCVDALEHLRAILAELGFDCTLAATQERSKEEVDAGTVNVEGNGKGADVAVPERGTNQEPGHQAAQRGDRGARSAAPGGSRRSRAKGERR